MGPLVGAPADPAWYSAAAPGEPLASHTPTPPGTTTMWRTLISLLLLVPAGVAPARAAVLPDSPGRVAEAREGSAAVGEPERSPEGDDAVEGAPDAEEPESPPSTFEETVVVTAARAEQPLLEAPAMVTVLTRRELLGSAAVTLDETLRRVPGLSLFRRASSLVAHPTTQGVSLRGIGPSGTSRSLVLFDGMPLNDPFGGWVVWNRIPPTVLEAVEVVRGATSPLYGSSALGGTIQLLPREPRRDDRGVRLRLGERQTGDVELYAADAVGPWRYQVAGRAFDTGGYFLLGPEDRGAVDRPAGVRFESLFARTHRGGYHLGAQLYREERGNGTALQVNDSRLATVEGGYSGERLSWSAYHQDQRFRTTFSRVTANRAEEFVTARQNFPAEATGGSVTYRLGHRTRWLVGADLRRVVWDDPEAPRSQDLAGVFVQGIFEPTPRLGVVAGGRVDLWENRTSQTAFSPRLGLVYRIEEGLHLRASVYRGFRAPTLNELYRPFRVGNIVTAANPALDAERLTGVEVGADLSGGDAAGAWLVRVNLFANRFDDPVGNVTLEVGPELIRRQRQNLGRVRIRGAEAEAELTRGPWRLRGAWLLSEPEVEATGHRLPQVPRHQASLAVDRDGPVGVTVEGRWVGDQFEDDLNQLTLPGFVVVDAVLRAGVGGGMTVTAAVENLFDRTFAVGRLPLERLGAPRQVWVGMRWRWR